MLRWLLLALGLLGVPPGRRTISPSKSGKSNPLWRGFPRSSSRCTQQFQMVQEMRRSAQAQMQPLQSSRRPPPRPQLRRREARRSGARPAHQGLSVRARPAVRPLPRARGAEEDRCSKSFPRWYSSEGSSSRTTASWKRRAVVVLDPTPSERTSRARRAGVVVCPFARAGVAPGAEVACAPGRAELVGAPGWSCYLRTGTAMTDGQADHIDWELGRSGGRAAPALGGPPGRVGYRHRPLKATRASRRADVEAFHAR